MQYKSIPVTLVSVESGKTIKDDGDHLVVETEMISQIDLEKTSQEIEEERKVDVFVLCLENRATGEQQSLAMTYEDLVRVTRENLMHLSIAGDEVSKRLLHVLDMLNGNDDCGGDDYGGGDDEFDTSG